MHKYDSKELSLEAIKRVSDIEIGKIKKEDLERVETDITLLLASIQDCVRLRMREKQIEYDELERYILVKKSYEIFIDIRYKNIV